MSTPRNTPFARSVSALVAASLAGAALTLVGCGFGLGRVGDCDPDDSEPTCDGGDIRSCVDDEVPYWTRDSCQTWMCSEASGRAACVPPDPEPLASEGTVDACTHLRPVARPGLLEIPQPARPARPVAALPKDDSGSGLSRNAVRAPARTALAAGE
jgi:hypothetical protein